jgi:two-component system, sensor histidine kinase and response regulator
MRIPKRGTLARELTLMIVGSIATAVAILGTAFLLLNAVSSRSALENRLITLADIVSQNSTAALNFGDADAAQEVLSAFKADDHIVLACLYGTSGDLFSHYQRSSSTLHCPEEDRPSAPVSGAYRDVLRPVLLKGEYVGKLLIVSDIEELRSQQRRFMCLAGGLLLAIILLGSVGGSILQRHISAPVNELVNAMRAVTVEQKYDIRVALDGTKEINTLAAGFNRMLAEIERRGRELLQNKENLESELAARKLINLELEKARDEAESANRAKSEFLANMSHEIRTPMNGVIGMTELALESNLTAEQREYMTMAKMSAESLLSIINDILDFSKIEAGRIEVEQFEFNLYDLVSETLRSFAPIAHRKGLELAYDIRPAVPENVIGDPHRLRQVLLNVVANAVKFTERGEVVVMVESDAERGADMLHLTVRDTGIGIPSEQRHKIFEAFSQADSSHTRRYGGTGLGLAISSRLIRLMGGELWVDSQVGQGSEFHIVLPLPAGAPVSRTAPELLRGLSALVVDDNLTNRRVVAGMLTSFGMKADSVESALRGKSALETAAGAGDPYRLALIDGEMPDMDGFQLAEIIKRNPRLAGATVIMLTCGMRQPEQIARCRELGIHAYLIKPIRRSELLKAVVQALSPVPAATSPDQQRPAPAEKRRRLRLLAAEDNRVNQRLLLRLLEKEGHAVTVVEDGDAAVALSQQQKFNAILMDVQMPNMDGLQAARLIRARERGTGEHVPIIALTAHAMTGDREKCLDAGMDMYIAKPLDKQELLNALDTYSRAGDFLAETAPAAQPPTLDVTRALERTGGDRALLNEICELFLQESSSLVNQLSRSINEDEPDEVRRIAHRLKTSAGTIGGVRAYEAAVAVEHMSQLGSIANMAAPAGRLAQEVGALRNAVSEFLCAV